jgi:hypothetical protein
MSEVDEKSKHKNDDREVEWSFDFANISDGISNILDSLAGEEELTVSHFVVAKDSAENARVNIKFSVGKGNLSALAAGNDALLEANLKHVGEIELSESGDSTKSVTLKQKTKIKNVALPFKQGFRALANREDLEWNIQLSPDMPLSLDINGGVGPTEMDLSGLQVRSLKIDAGVGTLAVILPSQTAKFTADVDGGVGQVKITVPEHTDANLQINGGVGAFDVTIPTNAAVQIRADSGLGSVNVPKSLKRLSKKDFIEQGGLWQTEGFDLAERRIIIRFKGGVGAFNLRMAEIL